MGSLARHIFLFLFGVLAGQELWAVDIPKGLSEGDRREIVRTVGLNSTAKLLSNPYPLGGYPGFEVGWSLEFVSIRDIRRLGCTPGSSGCPNTSYSDQTEWRYSRLTIGKGLYQDIDIFFHMVPPIGDVGISSYGGSLRWAFFQAQFLPIHISAIGHFDHLNVGDAFINTSLGADVVIGVNVDNFSLYFGGGQTQAMGTFIGCVPDANGNLAEDCTVLSGENSGVDSSSFTVSQKVSSFHTLVGFTLHYENLFAAAQVDRYQDAVYSLKMGLRF